jgi:hypothetical protein
MKMSKQQEIKQKSRLGTLLMHKGLITRRQLDEALDLQSTSKLMLGEIMVEKGWITEKQLDKALKGQSRYRMVAAVGAVLLGPVQPFVASANASIDTSIDAEQYESKRIAGFGNMKPMSEGDMAEITGQGINENVAYLQDVLSGDSDGADAPETATMTALQSIFPGLNMLTDYEITDVEYYGDGPSVTLHEDGSIEMQGPKRIGEIAFKDVNFRGVQGPAMGDLSIKNLSMSEGSTITLRTRN